MQHFKFYNKQDVLYFTRIRRFETKLGEQVKTPHSPAELGNLLTNPSIKYVIFGIPEDIGVRGNFGLGGADSAWSAFLASFLNTQSNDFLSGGEILVLGHFDFGDLKFLIEQHAHDSEEKLNAYRHAVITIDEEVEELVK
ncbi:MAG: arginase, partial [Chitinophagaceae bacterium]|nr:arginase [Chitinophagaceae bacterium]